MRADVFKAKYNKGIDRYFFMLEQIEAQEAKGKMPRGLVGRLAKIARDNRGLDAKFCREIPRDDFKTAEKIREATKSKGKAA